MSQIVGLVVLPNDGRPGNSRTRTDGILSSRPVIFSSCPTSRSERRGRTTFCRPVSSWALGSPPAGPYGGPGRLRTLINDGAGLGDAYGATLERIGAQDEEKAKLAVAALTWVCHAERPLQVDELCHALGVEIGETDFDLENVPSIGTLLDCCQGLITVDVEALNVRLIHYTVQEYLCSHPGLFSKPHSILAETCLTYLNSRQVKRHTPHALPDHASTPFLKYSARYWGAHTNKDLSDNARTLALELLDQYEDHISAASLKKI